MNLFVAILIVLIIILCEKKKTYFSYKQRQDKYINEFHKKYQNVKVQFSHFIGTFYIINICDSNSKDDILVGTTSYSEIQQIISKYKIEEADILEAIKISRLNYFHESPKDIARMNKLLNKLYKSKGIRFEYHQCEKIYCKRLYLKTPFMNSSISYEKGGNLENIKNISFLYKIKEEDLRLLFLGSIYLRRIKC